MTTTELPPRRAYRDAHAPVLGGVAGGLARHLGVPVLWVRVAFLVGAAAGGLGIVLYAGLWLVLPTDAGFERSAPGLEGATRDGRRPGRARRLGDVGQVVALGALALGLLLAVEAVLGQGVVFWPVAIGLVGVALLWRQADEAQRERWLDTTGRIDPVRAVFGAGGWASYPARRPRPGRPGWPRGAACGSAPAWCASCVRRMQRPSSLRRSRRSC